MCCNPQRGGKGECRSHRRYSADNRGFDVCLCVCVPEKMLFLGEKNYHVMKRRMCSPESSKEKWSRRGEKEESLFLREKSFRLV